MPKTTTAKKPSQAISRKYNPRGQTTIDTDFVGRDDSFAAELVAWQRAMGRHDLPWQKVLEPYRVWVSEIMLQQTQVSTVVRYFEVFMTRFPSVRALAQAELDEVLGMWSGLGYYSRARNLHRCAQLIMREWGGIFPQTSRELETLPGVGPSTAAAIASICFKERVAIMDANVIRVITRYTGFDKDLALRAHLRQVRERAQALLPLTRADMPTYTQGIMDLGAMICTPKKPCCGSCPVQFNCLARERADPERYPVKTKTLRRSAKTWWLLCWIDRAGSVHLVKRPGQGVWANLYCLPVFESYDQVQTLLEKVGAREVNFLPPTSHALTHLALTLNWVEIKGFSKACLRQHSAQQSSHHLTKSNDVKWFAPDEWESLGLPAPIRAYLKARL
jgi:A/G-specific adenine glycosylase